MTFPSKAPRLAAPLLAAPLLAAPLLPVLLAGAAGCNLVLDIDRLDRGGGGAGGGGVEVLATGECNPGKIAVDAGHVYWTITVASGDEACPSVERNAIRRLAIGPSGPSGVPVDVVSTDLDGQGGGGRPWQIAVVGDDLFWVGGKGIVCAAKAAGLEQACEIAPITPAPCPALSLRRAADGLIVHGGDCAQGGEIRRYDLSTGLLDEVGFPVSGGFVHEIDVDAAAPAWVAWIDLPDAGCATEGDAPRRVNVALGPAGAGGPAWSSCGAGFRARTVFDVAVDAERLYWLQDDDAGSGALYVLPLSGSLSPSAKPALVVRGLTEPHALALDARNVYLTSLDRNGAVLFVPKSALDPAMPSLTAADLGALAENRELPYDITADDPEWVYWLSAGTTHAVERARKPPE